MAIGFALLERPVPRERGTFVLTATAVLGDVSQMIPWCVSCRLWLGNFSAKFKGETSSRQMT